MNRKIEARVLNLMLGKDFPLPAYATPGSAAMDLRACIDAPLTIEPGKQALVKTGLAINMKDPQLVAIVASRSGLSLKHQVHVAQGIGVIDSDYQGEIAVILANSSDVPYVVQPGERIAQLMFMPVTQVNLEFVSEFSTMTDRGAGGFGSTGKS